MAREPDLNLLVNRIKAATGLKQEGIAHTINYSRPYFSSMKNNNPVKLYSLLKKHFEKHLSSTSYTKEYETTCHTQKTYMVPQKKELYSKF